MKVPKVLLFMDISSGHSRELLRGISKYVHLHRSWALFACFHQDDKNTVLGSMEFQEKDIDGIISRDIVMAKKFIERGVPTIIAMQPRQMNYDVPYIIGDHKKIGSMAADYFIKRGFRNFAYCGFKNVHWSEPRMIGFQERLKKDGFTAEICNISIKAGNKNREHKRKIIYEWLKLLPKPIAILTVTDDMGQYIISVCNLFQIHIPEEVAVLGVGNDDLVCEFCNPPLSSIKMNTRHTGYEAAALLDKMMKKVKAENKNVKILPNRIVARQSTDIIAVEDISVSKAVRYIYQNAKRPISVEEVANAVSVGKRTLQRSFHKHLRCSISEKIRDTRVELIECLLSETNKSISEISSEMCFSSNEKIARFFKREKGISPVRYRQTLTITTSDYN